MLAGDGGHLAASLVGTPEVVFLDEPTTGVDPASRRELWALIRDLVEGGTTVLLTTQYLEEADHLAHRIAVLDQGRIVREGTAAELKAQLGGAVVEVGVGERDRVRTMTALAGRGAAAHGEAIAVPAPDGVGTLEQVLQVLAAAGIAPQVVGLRQPSLDDVFLALTGRPAAGPAAAVVGRAA
ncbi:hypothetical protein Drose_24525 [Dactylosporangium roseum]|uniref:Uncharacterized protein n=1 Tax=Dactylosporangium roseum TaxID=47989 RepID=A0ABY5YYS6_9ACTN|nr:AAA family ATPase [Dactylosporangium roseum]UWZ34387.1 hypothetical protein Drose_24525 [Dactylosporangium roseum]